MFTNRTFLNIHSTQNSYIPPRKRPHPRGTAEQKVPFEAMCLTETVLAGNNDYVKAYLVLSGGLDRHLRYSNLVKIVTLEEFIAKANQGQL